MNYNLKCWFQILRHTRLNEVIATDTYLENENQLKAIILDRYFLESPLKYRMLLV
jgi:hypothetical protein